MDRSNLFNAYENFEFTYHAKLNGIKNNSLYPWTE